MKTNQSLVPSLCFDICKQIFDIIFVAVCLMMKITATLSWIASFYGYRANCLQLKKQNDSRRLWRTTLFRCESNVSDLSAKCSRWENGFDFRKLPISRKSDSNRDVRWIHQVLGKRSTECFIASCLICLILTDYTIWRSSTADLQWMPDFLGANARVSRQLRQKSSNITRVFQHPCCSLCNLREDKKQSTANPRDISWITRRILWTGDQISEDWTERAL